MVYNIVNIIQYTHTPQTPTRTGLAHSTRTKRTDPVYGSVLFVRVLCASPVRVVYIYFFEIE